MSIFPLVAAAMTVIALAWLLPTLLRRRDGGAHSTQAASNLSILRDQLAELERDVARGTLSSAHYQQARDDLDRRVLEESAEAKPVVSTAISARGTALVLCLLLPLCAAGLYWQFGAPSAIDAASRRAEKLSPQQIEEVVAKLAARMAEFPDDGEGWALLARAYTTMQRYGEAVKAFERATSLLQNNADLLADYADALAVTQGRRIAGEPLKLVEKALRIDPGQWKALAMAGAAAFERKEYKTAIKHWETLLARIGAESEFSRTVTENIAEARELGGIKAAPAKKTAQSSTAAVGTVSGTVSLSPALAAKANPTDTVFIFARAAQGPRMPLAILRRQVKDLPLVFNLDDSQAMSQEMKLSKFTEIVIGARISKSANAMPQSGDLQGASKTVKVGAKDVAVVIDSTLP